MNQKMDNPLTLAWHWLSDGLQHALVSLHLAGSNNDFSPVDGFSSRKILSLLSDKTSLSRRLQENSEIKSQFIQERQYVREQLEQRYQWLSHQLDKIGDPVRKRKIQQQIEAIQLDSAALFAQEKTVELKYEAWKSAFIACAQPGKAYRHFGKEFALSKDKYSKIVKNHGDLDSARLFLQRAQSNWQEAEQQLTRSTESARRLEKEFEQAAAIAWPLWKSEAGSITTQMLEAA